MTITKYSFTVSQDSAPTVLHEIKIMIMEATIMNDVLNVMVPYPMVPKFMMDLSHAVDKAGGVAENVQCLLTSSEAWGLITASF